MATQAVEEESQVREVLFKTIAAHVGLLGLPDAGVGTKRPLR